MEAARLLPLPLFSSFSMDSDTEEERLGWVVLVGQQGVTSQGSPCFLQLVVHLFLLILPLYCLEIPEIFLSFFFF